MSEEGNEIQAIVSLCGVEPSPTNSGNIVYQGEEWVPLEAYREAMAGWKAANEAQVGEHQSAFDHHYRSACPCVAAERHAETCPKHGHPTHTGEHLAVAKGGGLTPDDEANWLRGDWYERWQDATENADDGLMSTLESLRGRVEQTIKAALAERPGMPMPDRVLFGEAANLVYRIEAAGHLSYEAQNFERWKADARVLAPRLRHALALLSQDRGEGVESPSAAPVGDLREVVRTCDILPPRHMPEALPGASGCILPRGHFGNHIDRIGEGYYFWTDGQACDCCDPADADRCFDFGKAAALAAIPTGTD